MRFPWEIVLLTARKDINSYFHESKIPLDVFKIIFFKTLRENQVDVFRSKSKKNFDENIYKPKWNGRKKRCIEIFI